MTRGRRGCWTCRIRHRKCDEQVPDCRECTDRHITCHGYDLDPPGWMANDQLLQEEAQRIKAAVKENFRRIKRVQNRRLAQVTAQGAQASRAAVHRAVAASDSQARNTTFREAQYLVHYLDYIFPIQYTFYVDAPEEGGRGWLFFLLERSTHLFSNPTRLVLTCPKALLYAMLLLHCLHFINTSLPRIEPRTRKMNSSATTQKPYRNFDR